MANQLTRAHPRHILHFVQENFVTASAGYGVERADEFWMSEGALSQLLLFFSVVRDYEQRRKRVINAFLDSSCRPELATFWPDQRLGLTRT